MWNPTHENVQKHINEQKSTLKDSLELKKVVKDLDKEDYREHERGECFHPREAGKENEQEGNQNEQQQMPSLAVKIHQSR